MFARSQSGSQSLESWRAPALILALCGWRVLEKDTRPFAQRTWIALLEADPTNPKLFDWKEVNFFNLDLADTIAFRKVSARADSEAGACSGCKLRAHLTFSSDCLCCSAAASQHGVIDGEELRESMDMCYWADAKYPQNPLQPASAEGVAAMKALIAKYTNGEFSIVAPLFQTLMATSAEAVNAGKEKLFATSSRPRNPSSMESGRSRASSCDTHRQERELWTFLQHSLRKQRKTPPPPRSSNQGLSSSPQTSTAATHHTEPTHTRLIRRRRRGPSTRGWGH